ncbi:hypothetical protein J4526_05635 [Desulfurococcaceae archaeon MEX13E-LK6-19]|nr:hypothetical protein J4526_05635 [Desulfurococcaceae archaeon MEX13E-LK6-19]
MLRRFNLAKMHMKIIGKSVFALVFIVAIISSFVCSIMYFTINSFQEILADVIVGPRQDSTIIFTSPSTTPFTGVFDTRRFNALTNATGVRIVSSELLVPVLVNDKPVIMRGVDEGFIKTVNIKVIDGRQIDLDCLYCIWVGFNAAKYLGVSIGDKVNVSSFFSKSPMCLLVAGIYSTNSIYDDEILAPMPIARILRGVGEYSATIVKIVYDKNVTTEEKILESLNIGNITSPEFIERPQTRASMPIYVLEKIVGVQARMNIMVANEQYIVNMYLRRMGLSSDVFYAVSIAVLVIANYSMFVLGKLVTVMKRRVFFELYVQGIHTRFLKTITILFLLPVIVCGTLIGILFGLNMVNTINVPILFGYTVKPVIDNVLILLIICASIILFSSGIILSRVDTER